MGVIDPRYSNFQRFSKNPEILKKSKFVKFLKIQDDARACPREPRAQELYPPWMVMHPLKHTFLKLFNKTTQKTTQSHKWIPKCVNLGPKKGTKTYPSLVFVWICSFSWFCYHCGAVCLLIGSWGTRHRAKKSSGNLFENTPFKKN